MLIFSYDKKNLMDCVRVSIEKNIGGKKDEKFLLIGWGYTVAALSTPTLGKYPDEESAKAELERIYEAFANGATAYEVK